MRVVEIFNGEADIIDKTVLTSTTVVMFSLFTVGKKLKKY